MELYQSSGVQVVLSALWDGEDELGLKCGTFKNRALKRLYMPVKNILVRMREYLWYIAKFIQAPRFLLTTGWFLPTFLFQTQGLKYWKGRMRLSGLSGNADTGALAGAESLVQVRISIPQSINTSEGGA